MRDAVDLDCDPVRRPLHVQVVAAVRATNGRLPVRGWQTALASDQIGVALGERLDAAGGVQDGLDDQCPMAAGTSPTQRLQQLPGADQLLLYGGKHDGSSAVRCTLPAGGVDDRPGRAGTARLAGRMDIDVGQHGGPVGSDPWLDRASTAHGQHHLNPVLSEAGEPVDLQGGESPEDSPRGTPRQGSVASLLWRERAVVSDDDSADGALPPSRGDLSSHLAEPEGVDGRARTPHGSGVGAVVGIPVSEGVHKRETAGDVVRSWPTVPGRWTSYTAAPSVDRKRPPLLGLPIYRRCGSQGSPNVDRSVRAGAGASRSIDKAAAITAQMSIDPSSRAAASVAARRSAGGSGPARR